MLRTLGHPALHVMLGVLFAILFTWPLLASTQPVATWAFMYGAWGVAVLACAALSFGTAPAGEDDWDDGEDD